MKRDLAQLADQSFDLIVVGGGITGAFIAWDAALRGLDVALLERGDFGHATSSASSKVIHGGIRYMQRGALGMVRESLRDRTLFRRIAPHLVHPLPFLIPTYGHGLKGKEILSAAMVVYELLGYDQNRLDDPEKRIPRFRVLSRREALELEPDLPARGLTGGIRYFECHMHSSERTTLAVVQAAAAAGARVANYVEATDVLRDRRRGMHTHQVTGVVARDLLGGGELTLRARIVANASGPWAHRVLARALGRELRVSVGLSKGVHLVTRPLTRSGAVALATRHRNEALVNRGGRHFFMIPWRGHSLVGTTNVPFEGDPAGVGVTETDVNDFIAEINDAYPAAALRRADVRHAFAGLYPLVDKDIDPTRYQGASEYQIFDHQRRDGVGGLVTVIGAKFTTAPNLARKSVDLVLRKLGRGGARSALGRTRVAGGAIDRFEEFMAALLRARRAGLDRDVLRDLALSYGSEHGAVLRLVEADAGLGERVAETRPVIAAEVVHAVRDEMAVTLEDVVFRRTGLGTIGHPGRDALERCARIMGGELGWSEPRVREEVERVEQRFAIAAAGDTRGGDAACGKDAACGNDAARGNDAATPTAAAGGGSRHGTISSLRTRVAPGVTSRAK